MDSFDRNEIYGLLQENPIEKPIEMAASGLVLKDLEYYDWGDFKDDFWDGFSESDDDENNNKTKKNEEADEDEVKKKKKEAEEEDEKKKTEEKKNEAEEDEVKKKKQAEEEDEKKKKTEEKKNESEEDEVKKKKQAEEEDEKKKTEEKKNETDKDEEKTRPLKKLKKDDEDFSITEEADEDDDDFSSTEEDEDEDDDIDKHRLERDVGGPMYEYERVDHNSAPPRREVTYYAYLAIIAYNNYNSTDLCLVQVMRASITVSAGWAYFMILQVKQDGYEAITLYAEVYAKVHSKTIVGPVRHIR